MKTTITVLAAGALALALLAPTAAQAAGTTILNEGFDDITALAGWSEWSNNANSQGWQQGDPGVFAAQSGAADAYLGARRTGPGGGFDLWLTTPLLDFNGLTELSFYLRSHGTSNYADQVEVRYDGGTGVFDQVVGGTAGVFTAPDQWTAFRRTIDLEGRGRLAIRYTGTQIDYAGIDSMKVMTAVPEPASALMLLAGLAGIGALRRTVR